MPKYEIEDSITVNSLFSFIDFEKFKESILLYKKDKVDGSQQIDTFGSIGSQDPQALFEKILAEEYADGANQWKFKLEKEFKRGLKVKMWAKRLESGHDMHRADFNMPNISMQQADSYVKDFDTKNTDPFVESMTVLSRDETHKYATVTRIISKIPMMTKRESVMAMKRIELPSGEVCWLMNTIEHPDYPKNNQYVKIDFFKGMKFSP